MKSSILAGLATLVLACSAFKQSMLPDITKPYTGTYECKSATLGEKEYVEEFSYIRLELRLDDTFSLYYSPKAGKQVEQTGRYVYHKDKKTLQFSVDGFTEIKREFPLDKGVVLISFPVGLKTLILRFEQN